MEDEPDDSEFTRPPLTADLVELCRKLNALEAEYIVLGGMAINIHGFSRNTEDIDFLIGTDPANEQKFFDVLSDLPDGAAKELRTGEVADYVVVRICDDITVDLMAKACGYDYDLAKDMITPVVIDGVSIPYASPSLLWKTKQTYREKDKIDQIFLRKLLEDRGEWPVV